MKTLVRIERVSWNPATAAGSRPSALAEAIISPKPPGATAMVAVGETVFVNPPQPVKGELTIPTAPGLGLTVNYDGIRDTRVKLS